MATKKLEPAAIDRALNEMEGWSVRDAKLHREYKFPDFSYAIGFMTTAAIRIEKIDHHPEWCNVYNRVAIDLSTHDSGGVTQKDVELAGLLESIAKNFLGKRS